MALYGNIFHAVVHLEHIYSAHSILCHPRERPNAGSHVTSERQKNIWYDKEHKGVELEKVSEENKRFEIENWKERIKFCAWNIEAVQTQQREILLERQIERKMMGLQEIGWRDSSYASTRMRVLLSIS